MSHAPVFFLPFIAAAALTCPLSAQSGQDAPKSSLTPRELFYRRHPEPTPPNAGRKAPSKTTPQTNSTADNRPPAGQIKGPDRPVVGLPGGGSVIPAAAGPALGLRYSIVKREGAEAIEVPADTVFHAGDGIQLLVQTNSPGYLYVVNKGSSGTWKPMFPAPEIAGGNNRVEAYAAVTLPTEKHRMTFDQQTGTENLFIVFSREPVPDFEELIYSLQDKPRPAAQPAKPPAPTEKVVMARANIDDATVGRLRAVYARDLIIESVTPATPPDSSAKKETAVYVVNPKGSADSRLVADLPLRHQ